MSDSFCRDSPEEPRGADDVAGRLDRLPWSRFHQRVIVALGVTWILDGLEVTLVGSLAPVLSRPQTLDLSGRAMGLVASSYLIGAVLGSLFFGHLADRFGRKRLFTITLLLYTVATAASGLAWDFTSLAAFRFLTGAGIGGEYSAINSAVQELMPARLRGRIDLLINGSFWLGAAAAAAFNVVLLNPRLLPPSWGWRLAFGLGALLALIALTLRRRIPESPRWLMSQGRISEAHDIVSAIERDVLPKMGPAHTVPAFTHRPFHKTRPTMGLGAAAALILKHYPKRVFLCATLMVSQAFLYNAFFFTYALVLVRFYHIKAAGVGLYLLPFALSNFAGAALLARFFDTIGRRPMMMATYGLSGVSMIIVAWLFRNHSLDVTVQTSAWAAIFFLASAGASGAYLTVGESFPLEIRARVIALFYALGTAGGGVLAPLLFTALIATGARAQVFWGYVLGASLMILGAVAEAIFGLATENGSLESIAPPLSAPPK